MPRLGAAELNIPDDVYAALVLVRDELDPSRADAPCPEWLNLDVKFWGYVGARGPACGTSFCIGGSICVHLAEADRRSRQGWRSRFAAADRRLTVAARRSPPLGNLFFSYDGAGASDCGLAVAAIDAYLSGADDPRQIHTPRRTTR